MHGNHPLFHRKNFFNAAFPERGLLWYIPNQTSEIVKPLLHVDISHPPNQMDGTITLVSSFVTIQDLTVSGDLMRHPHCGTKYVPLKRLARSHIYCTFSWWSAYFSFSIAFFKIILWLGKSATSSVETLDATSNVYLIVSFSVSIFTTR